MFGAANRCVAFGSSVGSFGVFFVSFFFFFVPFMLGRV